jgi:putative ATP-binding cassette transporter
MAEPGQPEAAKGVDREKGSLARRIAETRSLLGKVWRLAAPYWWAEEIGFDRTVLGVHLRIQERWIARGLLATIIAMAVGIVYISKLFNDWYGRFYDALQQKDAASFWVELQLWGWLVLVYLVVAVYRLWLRQMLSIRWRRWLTGVYVNDWLRQQTYYHMELTHYGADNPEQRIEQDIYLFTSNTLFIALGLLSEIMTLATFSVILWNLSGSLTLPFFGGLTIPGYMLWAAMLYAALGSWATYKIGRPLIRVNYELERSNADFRYRMVRIRENAESIALYRGEQDEGRRLEGAFSRIYAVWWDYMVYNKRLTWLNVFYNQAAGIFPIVVAAPRYFSGEIMLGAVMQTASAFGQVQSALSWFVDSFTNLADWKASVDRLTGFGDAMAAAQKAAAGTGFVAVPSTPPEIRLGNVDVTVPAGRALLEGVDLRIVKGDRVVLQGPSGSGKTTLFRVLAGLWPFGSGQVSVPSVDNGVLFLPQKPYLPIGSLREALAYPGKPGDLGDAEIAEALTACQLGHLAERLDEVRNWSLTLSPGEQQRLSVARAILQQPQWLFLDEATAAVDAATEKQLYGLLLSRLPDTTIVSIAHRPAVVPFHRTRLLIDPATRSLRSEPVPQPT